MKILILGSDGMLGHLLSAFLSNNSDLNIFNLSRNNLNNSENHFQCDVMNTSSFLKIVEKLKPDVIINSIGILIKNSSISPKNAIYINAYFPNFLHEISNKFNFKLIHISTDCVFSGKKGSYSENSYKDAYDLYGLTKSLGEINSPNHLTIRTSIIGPEIKKNREGLFNWFLNQEGDTFGYSNALWTGITTYELSKAIYYCLLNDVNGLWNLSSSQKINKYDLLSKIKIKFNLEGINLIKDNNFIIDKSMISKRKINYIVPSYDIMIEELFEYIKSNRNKYNISI
jgi:dTDP-4-dehydrorhamnose reductase